MTVNELFPDTTDFTELLSDAETHARTEWEMEFVSDLFEKWGKWSYKMMISEKQLEILRRIARGNNEQY